MSRKKWLSIITFSLYLIVTTQGKDYLYIFTPEEVLTVVERACFVAGSPVEQGHLLNSLSQVYDQDSKVEIGFIDFNTFQWPSKELPLFNEDITRGGISQLKKSLILFMKIKHDRSCLLMPNAAKTPQYVIHTGQMTLEIVTSFVNEHCGTFRQAPDGQLSIAGLHYEHIMQNLFHVNNVTDFSMRHFYQSQHNSINKSSTWNEPESLSVWQSCQQESVDDGCVKTTQSSKNQDIPATMAQCERLKTPPTQKDFFNDYVQRSRPFILEHFTTNWPAFTKWTNQYLQEKFGNKTVHVKMTPTGDYEGVESASIWEDFKTFQIPEKVKSQLKYSDLVVVRPAGVSMNFSEFIDLINEISELPVSERNVSAYLEYTSLAEYFQVLEHDINEPVFAKNLLTREHLNIWLSDGHTLGRLHFDPYDNLLCQLSGKKEVILFDPHDNQKLYEAHIPQAELSYNKATRKFRRKTLQDSTALVMSPVDIHNPDLKRFSKFLDAHPLNCTINEGDILFMPSFWWHEVKSSPSADKPRNLAINFWYKPFLTKEFPCEECPLDVNPFYFDKLG